MAETRELILKLGQKISDRIGHKVTTEDPEYWGLAGVVTDEMAKVALKMKVRKPMTLPQMGKLTKMPVEELEPLLEEMSYVGILEYNWENPKREKQYILPMYVPGSAEFFNMNEKRLEEHPELGLFFERMSRLPLEKVTPMVPPGGAGIGMHVIPVEKAIEMENQSVSIEHISHWLDKYEGKYAASPCSCRMSRKVYEEGCGDDPRDWCIAVGDMADYIVETDKGGHYVTKEEVMEILQRAEEHGFVHQITNIDGENKIFAICNCNVNVCYALRTSQLFNTPNMSRSAYVARVKPENCVACGRCVEYCPAGAVRLGQKLCTKDGPVQYPKHDLPDAMRWGPDKWDENYRDTNRINCYDTGTSPCKAACPAHIAVQGYLKKASEGKYREALALIKKENPFPAVCGHICNKKCEEKCTRNTIDDAVSIDEVKKFIAAKDMEAETRYIPPIMPPSNRGGFSQKIAIIGGGPAGLSCAYYLAERGYKPTVFERNSKPGGMLVYGIPSFKLEKDIVHSEIDVLREMGVDIRCGVDVGNDITIAQLREEGYEAFYFAIGAQKGRLPGIPGEDAEGVMTAVSLLRTVGEDNSHRMLGRTLVVGGGNVAIDAARTAHRCGSEETMLFCLEEEGKMPASEEEIKEAGEEGIRFQYGWGPKEVLSENGHMTAVIFQKCLSIFDENKRFAPVFDETALLTVPCDHVVFSIGQTMDWGNLLSAEQLEAGRGNTLPVDALTWQSKCKDIFAGGDAVTGPGFAINAIAAGKQAAESLHRYVQPHTTLTIGRNKREFIALDTSNVKIDNYDTFKRQQPAYRTDIDRTRSFRDSKLTFNEDQIKKETARCLSCGASVVDENKCIGCGICTTKCAFDAIHLYRERPECSTMVKSEDKLKAILPYMLKREFKIRFKGNQNKK